MSLLYLWPDFCIVETSEIRRMKIAIPRFGERVAPCFEHSATMAIFTVDGGKIVDQVDVPLQSREAFDRIRLMRAQKVEAVICGGIQEFFENMLKADGIEVISWVSGEIEDLLALYLNGRLSPGVSAPERNELNGSQI